MDVQLRVHVQAGPPRSASTLQFTVLCMLAHMSASPTERVLCRHVPTTSDVREGIRNASRQGYHVAVLKTNNDDFFHSHHEHVDDYPQFARAINEYYYISRILFSII